MNTLYNYKRVHYKFYFVYDPKKSFQTKILKK